VLNKSSCNPKFPLPFYQYAIAIYSSQCSYLNYYYQLPEFKTGRNQKEQLFIR